MRAHAVVRVWKSMTKKGTDGHQRARAPQKAPTSRRLGPRERRHETAPQRDDGDDPKKASLRSRTPRASSRLTSSNVLIF